jgi:outer membrane scaffolding protein for murein synthesis (MipA/OmpV family)
MKPINRLWPLASLLLIAQSASVRADQAAPADPSLMVGIGAVNTPRYSGSDQRQWQVVPLVQARDGAFFFDSQKGLGYDLQADNGLYLEHTLGYNLGRSDDNNLWRDGSDKLKGMGNISAVANTAIAVGWQATPWFSVEGKATLPLTDSQGVQYQGSVTLLPWQTSTDTVALQTAALFGDARYNNTFYGVNQQQSERSGYATYHSGGGFYGMQSSLTWNHQYSAQWGSMLIGNYTWLGDKADDSPIVYRRNEFTAIAAITYSF